MFSLNPRVYPGLAGSCQTSVSLGFLPSYREALASGLDLNEGGDVV